MWPFNRLSLFWKIFLWFWSVLILMVIVSVASWILSRDAINFHRADDTMKGVVDKLAYILESDLPNARKKRLTHRLLRTYAPPPQHALEDFPNFQPFYLVNQQQQLRSGAQPPEAIIALLNRGQGPSVAIHQDFVFVGPQNVIIDGESYKLFVSQFIGRFKGRLIFHFLHSLSIWQLIAYLVISGTLCFILAWSITKPIRLLQKTSRRIANGEVVSAVDSMGNRRDEFFLFAKDFDHMSDKILSTVNTQKQLLSDVSHELRSPLSRMQIALGLLEKKLGEAASHHIQRLEKECARMDEMIGQLLSIAALERGQLYENEQRIVLSELLNDIVRDAEFEASQKSVAITCELTPDLVLVGYYHLLYSAIENVIRNAIRYTFDNTQVNVALSRQHKNALITVTDQGPGVSVEHLDKLFDPFYRTDEARSREQGGSGLGLAISSKAILAHGGTIKAEIAQLNASSPGLRVIISLPLQS